MNYYKYILTALLLFTTVILYAQNDSITPIQVTCKVIDAKTKKPIEYAAVKIIKDSINKAKYTDSNGICYFDSLVPGTYTLYIIFIGYNKITITNIALNKSKVFDIALDSKPSSCCLHCNPRYQLINKTEPTHDNFNSRQIMRMPY